MATTIPADVHGEFGFDSECETVALTTFQETGVFTPADVPSTPYFQNDRTTLVVEFNGVYPLGTVQLITFLDIVRPDEMHTVITDEGRIALRLWWD